MHETIELKKRSEILQILQSIQLRKLKVGLWQSLEDHRHFTPSEIFEISKYHNTVALRPIGNKLRYEFDLEKQLYFHCSYRECIFKVNFKQHNSRHIVLNIPSSLIIQESRKNPRKHFSDSDQKYVIFNHRRPGQQKSVENKRKLLDISEGGLALKINRFELPHYNVGDPVFIKNDRDVIGGRPKVAKVRYTHTIRDALTGEVYYKVGLKFAEQVATD